jgi:transcription termination/antitermination protein NusG
MPAHTWCAIRTRAHQEQAVAEGLRARGIEEFFPSYMARRQWTDRVKLIEQPLFDGYVFAKLDTTKLVPVKSTPGVVQIVAGSISEAEMEAVRKLAASKLTASPCPYLREGMAVRVKSGPMKGVEGVLERVRSRYLLVISVHLLQRSVQVEIDAEAVEAGK